MLTDDMKRDLVSELATAQTRQAACIEAMQIVQRRTGWVSDETIAAIADFLDMSIEELESVATFYNHIYREPVGKHVILICSSVTCWILGYETLKEHIRTKLGIGLGETTEDGMFTLIPIQCLGACDKAPSMMIDDILYVHLTPEKFDSIVESYRN